MNNIKENDKYFPPITEGGRWYGGFKNIENEIGVSKSSRKHGVLHSVVNCLRSGMRKLKKLGFVSGTL